MLNVEELSFHDVYIIGINFSTKKDHFEQISIFLESEDFVSDFGTDKVILEFSDCYRANLQLQMWISGKDSIREFRFLDSSSAELKKINEMKEKGLIKKDDIFKHCEIILNTSFGKIEILAKEVSLVKGE
ncbi:MAG: hypothetical protein ACYDEJ_08440 [Desulfitobacteriaceae bacterium]